MRSVLRQRSGYTLAEAMIASTIIGIVLTAAISGFAFMMRGDRMVTTQNELDGEARLLLERLRSDLWLTARSEILLHPPGGGPYTAISFPVIRGGSTIETDGEGHKVWHATVMYHLWEGEEFQVRRTEFSPYSTMTKDERQQQLADVVDYGDGSNAANGENSTTRPVVKNLVDWEINITASRFDAYNATDDARRILLGSAQLDSGRQEITFRVVGKNRASRNSARYLGIDFLNVTPSALPVEGEWMEVDNNTGATAAPQNMPTNETWSGNARMWFPGTADGHEFTLVFTNDVWTERNFLASGDKKDRLNRIPTTVGGINTFHLQLEGSGTIWQASTQTGDASATNRHLLTEPTSYRVSARGDDPFPGFDGGWLEFNGSNVWIHFENYGGWARVSGAYFGESAVSPAETMRSGTSNQVLFASGNNAVAFSSATVSAPLAIGIERTNSYLIGYTLEPVRVGFDTQDGWPASISGSYWTRSTYMGSWSANNAPILSGVGRTDFSGTGAGATTNALNLEALNSYLFFPSMKGPFDLSLWARLNADDTTGSRILYLYYWTGSVWVFVGSNVVNNSTNWAEYAWSVNTTGPTALLVIRAGDTSSRELWVDDIHLKPAIRQWAGPAGATNCFVLDAGGSWAATSSVPGLSRITAGYPALGSYVSAVIDTQVEDPEFGPFIWSEVLPSGFSINPSVNLRIRASDDFSMTNSIWVTALNGSVPVINGRYVQVAADLKPGVNTATRASCTPLLQRFNLSWDGASRFVSMEGKFSVGNTHGIYEVEVNGVPMLRGVTIDLTVYKDIAVGFGDPKRITASAYTEVVPRN